ncbi:MAG: cysteine--tRNA ligase, partial [Acidobacteriota bacterium]|nr:cysteine--tRNA ligase [Acidobacteriota bacterium]
MRIIRPISLYNTLTRKIEPISPITPGEMKIYSCGPTVYNFAHIGNLRTFLFQDLMKRTLLAAGYQVRHCMNITDVEDKIIRDSQGDLPPDAPNEARHEAMKALTDKYTAFFLEDLAAMRILTPDKMPKATDHIGHMKALIQTLIGKDLAYARDGSVYYRIAGFPAYGCLAHLDREGMQSGTSVDVDEYEKDQAQDFVLWKAGKPGEPTWDSPWGPGRPGWHIECSAMGIEILGDRVDIHTGGVDLVFPHHENEIAQSEGALGHPWVSTWVHGEFLMVEGEKMSKSLGNFYTLRDLVEKGFDPVTFRYAIQSNHYRKLINFSFEGLKAADNSLKRIRAFRRRMEEAVPGTWEEAGESAPRLEKARTEFWAAMGDDLNTPEALAAIFTLISDLNALDDREALSNGQRKEVIRFLDETDSIFAAWPHEAASLDAEIEALIAARKEARDTKNWAESDRLR